MGAVAARGNMAAELFQACNAVFSGIRGALANATIGACALFGAICGSSIATAATFSKVAIPEMRRHGYDPAFAAGAVASAGTLDVLIPPSVLIAIYAIVAEQSLVKLYAAAFIPGFVLAGLYVVAVWIVAWLRPELDSACAGDAVSRAAARLARHVEARRAVLLRGVRHLPRLVLADRGRRDGGVRGDRDCLCDPRHELAGSDRLHAGDGLHHGDDLLHRGRRVHLLPLHRADADSRTTCSAWVQAAGLSPFWIIMAVMALYILLGTFLDEVSTILITVPVTLPLITGIGYDGIWFGIFVTVMCTIGLISPPTGMTVFVIQAQHPDIPVMRIYMGTLPFLVADFVLVALLIFMPSIALWLPRVLY